MIDFLDTRLPQRFWDKCIPEPNSGCWIWIANVNQNGYARISVAGRMWCGHRYAYETLIGSTPAGMELDHKCRERSCVNPAHLEPVTHRVNTLRGTSGLAINARKTHCPKGHAYDEANTYSIPSRPGSRYCRECQRESSRKREKFRIRDRTKRAA